MRVGRRWLLGALGLSGLLAAADFEIGFNGPLDSLSAAAGLNSYLIVWRDLSAGAKAPQMTGVMVSNTGVAAPSFPISNPNGLPLAGPVQLATAAFDGVNFLAVWADDRPGGTGIWGALITSQGQGKVIGGSDFQIAATNQAAALAPQVVFNGADYVVAWQDTPPSATGTQIYFARVSTAGAVTPPALLPAAEPNPAQALEFLVAGAANETLLVFQDLAAAPVVTCATRLALDSSISGPPTGAVLFNRDYLAQGFGTAIGAAFDGVNYQILSSYGAQTSSTVFKAQLAGGVVDTPAPFAQVGQGATGLAEDNFPCTFYNTSGAGGTGEFLFVRNSKVSSTVYHLLSKRVALNSIDLNPPTEKAIYGTDRDPTMPVIDDATRGVLNGAVAVSIGSQYLVVWMDGRIPDAQPAWQTNVFGVFLDDTQVGDTTRPYLTAVANVQPTFGASPLTVYFNIDGSTGQPDSINWDFGDGATFTKYNSGSTKHIYQNGGTYTAVLSLVQAGFAMHDFAVIQVDTQALGGGGGPPELAGGLLGPVSAGVNTAAVITNASVNLDFTKPNDDRLQMYGHFDPSVLPLLMDGQQCTLVIAGVTYSFTTDVNGNYTSPSGQTPVVRFSVNNFSGYFSLTTSSDNLAAAFAALGAGNEDVSKPGQALPVPFTLTFDLVQLASTLNTIYLATAGKSGSASYVLSNTGSLASGSLYITGAKAVESDGKTITDTFTVYGNMLPGGGQILTPAAAGNWQITLGNYAEALPASSLSVNASSNIIFYRPAQGKTNGISQFTYNTRTGYFSLVFKKLPAQGPAYSGMALASSSILREDLALSFSLDLAAGTAFQASVFVRFVRQAWSKRWTLR